MLSPEYLAQCTSYLLGMMDLVNEQLVADIARRIVKTGALTESAQFEAEKLTQQNILYKDIVNSISKVSGLTEAEIVRVFEEANFENMESENLRAAIAGKTPIDHASNVAMGNLLSSHIRKTKGVVKNLTRTTASQGQNAFINAVNLANMQVSSGTFTYDFAIKNAIKQVAKSGLTVQYPTGHIDKLDVAVRRAVLTGVNQSSAELNMLYCDEIGTDLVEVTAHSGARPSHADWQGGVYSLSGKSKGYGSFYDITGYGTGEGLCGWNCRHSFYAYYEGTERTYSKEYLDSLDSKTYEYGGETYTNYEAGQKQRDYERAIRAEKRYFAGLNSAYNETKDDTLRQSLKYEMESSAVNLKRKEAELKYFCKATDRRIDTTRTQVYAIRDVSGKIIGFDRSAAQRAIDLTIKGDKIILGKSAFLESDYIPQWKGKFDNKEVRLWYVHKTGKIPKQTDQILDLEERAKMACRLRNKYRFEAREMMRDQSERKRLDYKDPIKSFEELIKEKMDDLGLDRLAATEYILNSATRTRKSVNRKLGLEK
ncbi:MAG: phage minor capsid protein [[Eubacterium] sulci]|nr:phage minor capsid protein [[Eubacterium] sulci]